MIRDELETTGKDKAINSCESAVCLEVRLEMKLRYLEGSRGGGGGEGRGGGVGVGHSE